MAQCQPAIRRLTKARFTRQILLDIVASIELDPNRNPPGRFVKQPIFLSAFPARRPFHGTYYAPFISGVNPADRICPMLLAVLPTARQRCVVMTMKHLQLSTHAANCW